MYLFTCTGVQYDFHIRWCSCHLTVTITDDTRVAYPSGAHEFFPGFKMWLELLNLYFCVCNVLTTIVCLCVVFSPLFILYVLQFTVSYYPFGLELWCLTSSVISAVSFIGGGNQSTRKQCYWLNFNTNKLLSYVFGCHISYVTVANYGYPIYVIVPNMHCTLKSIGLPIFLLWDMIWCLTSQFSLLLVFLLTTKIKLFAFPIFWPNVPDESYFTNSGCVRLVIYACTANIRPTFFFGTIQIILHFQLQLWIFFQMESLGNK